MKLFEKNRSYKYIVFRIAPFVFIRRNIKLIIYALLNKEREAKSIAYAIAIKKKTDCPDRRAA